MKGKRAAEQLADRKRRLGLSQEALTMEINEERLELAVAREREAAGLNLADCPMPHAKMAGKGMKKCPKCKTDLTKLGDGDGDEGGSDKDKDGDGKKKKSGNPFG